VKKLSFEDLQPHVDMLIDALENKGASSSGIPHSKGIAENANKYRELLELIRTNNITFENLTENLSALHHVTLILSENNQYHRIQKIVKAIDIFMLKEYNKLKNATIQNSTRD
jgi:hypothetical protein